MSKPRLIGTRQESSLHRSLKLAYAGEDGQTEVERHGYICDGVTGDGRIIEVQTGSFGPLREKVRVLSATAPVLIVHPVIVKKHIELYDADGVLLHRRPSPRKGGLYDLFHNLLYAPELPLLPGVAVEVAPVEVVERRVQDGNGSWRRKGASVQDKVLLARYDTVSLRRVRDYARFLPFQAEEQFTAPALSRKAGISCPLARRCLYVLMRLALACKIGKRGTAWVYRRSPPFPHGLGARR